MNCELCGGNVEVVGNTTRHYRNLDQEEIKELQSKYEKLVKYREEPKEELLRVTKCNAKLLVESKNLESRIEKYETSSTDGLWMKKYFDKTDELVIAEKKVEKLKLCIERALSISDLWTYGERNTKLPMCEIWLSEGKALEDMKKSFEKILKEHERKINQQPNVVN